MSNSLQHHGLYNPWNSPSQNTGVDSISPSPGDLPNPSIEPRSSALQADSSPAEPQGNSKNTGVGSLSLLQGIFPTQGSNPGLPLCGQTLYRLSHQGSHLVVPGKPSSSINTVSRIDPENQISIDFFHQEGR